MMYSHDGFGLGHLRRNTTIANRLVAELPGSSVLLLVGSPAGAFFPLAPGIDFMKIPSVVKVGTGTWHPRTRYFEFDRTREIRVAAIQKAAELFRPDILVVDYLPTGVWGELRPTLEMLRGREDRPTIVLGLREILDDPRVSRELWTRDGAYEAIERYYDWIFVYGCREVFDTARHYGLDGPLGAKVRHCGYLSSADGCPSGAEIRAELGMTGDRLLLVTAGGGYDGYPMMSVCLRALPALAAVERLQTILVTGPLMARDQRDALRRQASGLRIRVLPDVEDGAAYMSAADVVVTMAGYNTLVDALRLRKRIVVVPRRGPSAEQRLRARLFADLGLVHVVDADQLTPLRLTEAIRAALATPPGPLGPVRLDGLSQVVAHLRMAAPAPPARLAPIVRPDTVGLGHVHP